MNLSFRNCSNANSSQHLATRKAIIEVLENRYSKRKVNASNHISTWIQSILKSWCEEKGYHTSPRHKKVYIVPSITCHGFMSYGFKLGDLQVRIKSCSISCVCFIEKNQEQYALSVAIADQQVCELICMSRLRTQRTRMLLNNV